MYSQYAIGFLTCVAIVFGVSYWTIFSPGKLEFELWGHSEVSGFGIVFSAFLLLIFQKIKVPTLPAPVYPLLIISGLVCYWWSMPIPVRGFLAVGLFALVVNALATAPPTVKKVLSLQPLRFLGLYSFSIYLWQQVFYLAHHRDGLPNWIALVISIACGIASFYFIENPIRLYLNNYWGKETPYQQRLST